MSDHREPPGQDDLDHVSALLDDVSLDGNPATEAALRAIFEYHERCLEELWRQFGEQLGVQS